MEPERGARAVEAFPPYDAPRLLRGFHRMTLVAALGRFERVRALPAESRVFDVDGGRRALALCTWAARRQQVGTLVLVHGLSGSAESPYMRGTARKALAAGLNVVRLNLRGAGGGEPFAETTYHAGLTDELAALVRELIDRDGCRELHLVGFSLGGNVVLRQAALWGGEPPGPVASAAAVSPCVDLAASARCLDGDRSLRLYRRAFLAALATLVRRLAARGTSPLDPQGLSDVRTLRDFDGRYVAPVFGFDDADDYYARASALPLLDRVRLPTLIIHSRDDRLVPDESFVRAQVRENPALTVVLTEHGGHCAFIGQRTNGDADRYWAENRVIGWARSQQKLVRSPG